MDSVKNGRLLPDYRHRIGEIGGIGKPDESELSEFP